MVKTRARVFLSALSALAIVCLWMVGLASARVAVCRLCGREVQLEAAVCGHCGADLAPTKEPVADDKQAAQMEAGLDHVFSESGSLEHIGLRAVKAEFDLGQRFVRSEDEDVARSFFRNALALERLTLPDATGGNRRDALQAALRRSETFDEPRRHPCLVCGGSDTMTMTYQTFSGGIDTREVKGKLCPRCRQSGFIVKPGTVAQRLERMAVAEQRFEQLQTRRGYRRSGLAWVPPEVAGTLSPLQQALLNREMAAPCSQCGGAGAIDCRACSGLGEIKCQACEMGLATVHAGGVLSREKLVRTEPCKVCGGRGILVCERCESKGREQCTRCNGTGERAECSRCDGTGVVACRRCRGTGAYRGAACTACGGHGETLCATCQGDGKAR